VAYSLKARIVESQQPAFTRPWPVISNRGLIFSAHSVPIAVHAAVEYIVPSLSNSHSSCVCSHTDYMAVYPRRYHSKSILICSL
jgi:hypothetical protein